MIRRFIYAIFRKSLASRSTSALSSFHKAIEEFEKINAEAEKKVISNQKKVDKAIAKNENYAALIAGNSNIAGKLKEIVAPV